MTPSDLDFDLSWLDTAKPFEQEPTTVEAKPAKREKFLLSREPNTDDEYVMHLDNSSIEAFLGCDKVAQYRLVYRRTTAETAALVYGGAIHESLDLMYSTIAKNEPLDIAAIKAKGLAKLATHPSEELEWRNDQQLNLTIDRYIKQYYPEQFTIFQHNGQPAVELPFTYSFGSLDLNCHLQFAANDLVEGHDSSEPLFVKKLHIVYTGKIDLIVRQAGKLWILDHKTTSIEGQSYYDNFVLSSQFRGYTRIASLLLGKEIAGAFVNVIIARKPSKTGIAVDFKRVPFMYKPSLLDEWHTDVLRHIENFVYSLQRGHFPMRTIWCVNKFQTCPYLAVCNLPPSQRMQMLASTNYHPNTWSPLD